MKTLNQVKRQKGFTIIEVLIVLAIAALILLIVFLAVPSLQRNARNTQRKSDAANLGAAVANFSSNSNGALPSAMGTSTTADTKAVYLYCNGVTLPLNGITTNIQSIPAATTTGCDSSNKTTDSAKLGYYTNDATHVFLTSYAPPAAGTTVIAANAACSAAVGSVASLSTDCVVVNLKYPCNSSATDSSNTTSSRAVSVLWVQETNGGVGNLQCVEP